MVIIGFAATSTAQVSPQAAQLALYEELILKIEYLLSPKRIGIYKTPKGRASSRRIFVQIETIRYNSQQGKLEFCVSCKQSKPKNCKLKIMLKDNLFYNINYIVPRKVLTGLTSAVLNEWTRNIFYQFCYEWGDQFPHFIDNKYVFYSPRNPKSLKRLCKRLSSTATTFVSSTTFVDDLDNLPDPQFQIRQDIPDCILLYPPPSPRTLSRAIAKFVDSSTKLLTSSGSFIAKSLTTLAPTAASVTAVKIKQPPVYDSSFSKIKTY